MLGEELTWSSLAHGTSQLPVERSETGRQPSSASVHAVGSGAGGVAGLSRLHLGR